MYSGLQLNLNIVVSADVLNIVTVLGLQQHGAWLQSCLCFLCIFLGYNWHYNDVKLTSRSLKSRTIRLFFLTAYANPYQSPHYWPFVRGVHWWPMNSPHKGPVTRKKLACDDVIMNFDYVVYRIGTINPNDRWHLVDIPRYLLES